MHGADDMKQKGVKDLGISGSSSTAPWTSPHPGRLPVTVTQIMLPLRANTGKTEHRSRNVFKELSRSLIITPRNSMKTFLSRISTRRFQTCQRWFKSSMLKANQTYGI